MAPARKVAETSAKPPEPKVPESDPTTADQTPAQPPSMCRIVVYTLSAEDVARIEYRRTQARARTKYAEKYPRANDVHEGDAFPMLIVRAWDDGSVNGQVSLDGEDNLWTTSVKQGADAGTWAWPERV
jgi:hypothetical protein